jgi:hypothetical protein
LILIWSWVFFNELVIILKTAEIKLLHSQYYFLENGFCFDVQLTIHIIQQR